MFELHRDSQQFCFQVHIISRHPVLIIAWDAPRHWYFELLRLSWSSSEGFEIQRSYPY